DRIIVLDKGRVVQDGPTAQIIKGLSARSRQAKARQPKVRATSAPKQTPKSAPQATHIAPTKPDGEG
ncbi:MAG: hypothetical protein AAGM04_08700, partial [Pseudomonadota bacterium]